MEVLFYAGVTVLFFLFFQALLPSFDARRTLTPAEEQAFELVKDYPSLAMEDISPANIQEVVNYTLENGEDHPLLKARKERGLILAEAKLCKIREETQEIIREVLANNPSEG